MQLQKLAGAAFIALLANSLTPVVTYAKGGGHGPGAGGAVSHKPTMVARPVTTTTRGGSSMTTHGKGSFQRATKPVHSATHGQGSTHGSTTHSGTTASGPTTTTTTGGVDPTTMTKAQEKLAQNSNLRSRLQSRLPIGTDIQAAAAGFRNLGQFVAAVNVSHNLGISFDALKLRMTGPQAVSLGQAIQEVKGLNAAVSSTTAQTALAQAEVEIESSTTTTTTTPTRKPAKRRS